MPDKQLDLPEFKFPDEEQDQEQQNEEVSATDAVDDQILIEVEDDTPETDRDREPVPQEVVQELESDELKDYSLKVKNRLIQMKKVWHDERRAKEAAYREQQEALNLARKAIEENKILKSKLSEGEQVLVSTYKQSADQELEMAKREYREAYESGDTDRIIEAQEKMTVAKMKTERANEYRPVYKETLQTREDDVQTYQRAPKPDQKTMDWQNNNQWFGKDEEMTSLALGLHEKLKREGVAIGSDEYYKRIDNTIRKRFPEQFEEVKTFEEEEKPVQRTKSNVVAPATRSTSSKKIKLTTSQVAIAKKLGLTPEQYVRELMKMEA
jgi:hypothetical protein